MSYTPTNWQTGDTVTAERLNKMESGIQTAVDPFIVNLTPTEQDYSGVMDKTIAEINEAYEAGRKIAFTLWISETDHFDLDCTAKWHSDTYPSFNAYFTTETPFHALVYLFTSSTSGGDRNTYRTYIYPLTPMS